MDETAKTVNSSTKPGQIVDEPDIIVNSSIKSTKIVDEIGKWQDSSTKSGKNVDDMGIGALGEEFYESKIIISYICRLYEARLV